MNVDIFIFLIVFLIVLIDTWWNVNKDTPQNRNKAMRVLIDTWWNVNFADCSKYLFQFPVLIDTWWNVNFGDLIIFDEFISF